MTNIALCGLSTAAIVFLLKYTDGPFDIFYRLRKASGMIIPLYDTLNISIVGYAEDDDPERFWALWFRCFWCMSTWIAFFVSIAYILLMRMPVALFPFLWFASIGVSGLLLELLNKWRE
jgi:hypothetical protein